MPHRYGMLSHRGKAHADSAAVGGDPWAMDGLNAISLASPRFCKANIRLIHPVPYFYDYRSFITKIDIDQKGLPEDHGADILVFKQKEFAVVVF
jgi:hypothetical protein